MDNTVYQQKSKFGIVVLVMCEVALQSKSAQIVSRNVLEGNPLNDNGYTTEYPESLCLAL